MAGWKWQHKGCRPRRSHHPQGVLPRYKRVQALKYLTTKDLFPTIWTRYPKQGGFRAFSAPALREGNVVGFLSPSHSSFIRYLFIWVYCFPCVFCPVVYSVPEAAEMRHRTRKYRTNNHYLRVLWNKPRKSLWGEGGIRRCLFLQRQY